MFGRKKINDSAVIKYGFLGGIAEVVYCFLVALFVMTIDKVIPEDPVMILNFLMVLILFVVSAGISGILVFGYPANLALQKKFNEAVMTAAISLGTIAIAGILVFVLISFL